MEHTATPPTSEAVAVPALAEYLAQIPEYRQARGTQHPLLALLLLVCVAMLCGARSQSAIADWGQHHGPPWLRRLGFTKDRAPSQPPLSRLFQRVPHKTVEAVLGRWAERALRCCPAPPGTLEGVAVDGKTLRGSKRQGAADAHLLSAFSHRLGVVLGQTGVPDKTNEIGAASEFLLSLVLEGRVLTADALLTQREIAQTILDSGGDYLLVVKENQPTLLEDLTVLFDDPTTAVQAVEDVTLQRGRVECGTCAPRVSWSASATGQGYSRPCAWTVPSFARPRGRCRRSGRMRSRPSPPPASSRPTCWLCGGGTGTSRISRTTCGM